MTDDFSQLFDLMDRWRHLPKYKLEGNLQPFFGLVLKDILSKNLKVQVLDPVIPEFPLLIDTQSNGKQQRRSKNVDFLALTEKEKENERTAYLVELKTDNASFKYGQLKDYLEFADKGLCHLVKGVLYIAGGGGARQRKNKYGHLLHLLEKLELITIKEQDILYKQYTKKPNSWPNVLRPDNISLHPDISSISTKVVYIVPDKCKFNEFLQNSKLDLKEYLRVISFKEIQLEPQYAKFDCWLHQLADKEKKAGKPCPRTIHK